MESFKRAILLAVLITLTFWLGQRSAGSAESKREHNIKFFDGKITPPNKPSKPAGPSKPSKPAKLTDAQLDRFFRAISKVESNHNDNAVGDGGKAIGRYQIWKVYWQDAVERLDKDLCGQYNDVKNKEYAELIMRLYWQRYVPEAYYSRNWEVLARVHNGGPKGHRRDTTIHYWKKVQKCLQSLN
jgi:hypothetical protein